MWKFILYGGFCLDKRKPYFLFSVSSLFLHHQRTVLLCVTECFHVGKPRAWFLYFPVICGIGMRGSTDIQLIWSDNISSPLCRHLDLFFVSSKCDICATRKLSERCNAAWEEENASSYYYHTRTFIHVNTVTDKVQQSRELSFILALSQWHKST